MKKLIFNATLLVAFIIIPSLAFSDENMDEIKIISFTPTEITNISNDRIENPQFTIENNDTNSVPIKTIDDGWENRDQNEIEFRLCG